MHAEDFDPFRLVPSRCSLNKRNIYKVFLSQNNILEYNILEYNDKHHSTISGQIVDARKQRRMLTIKLNELSHNTREETSAYGTIIKQKIYQFKDDVALKDCVIISEQPIKFKILTLKAKDIKATATFCGRNPMFQQWKIRNKLNLWLTDNQGFWLQQIKNKNIESSEVELNLTVLLHPNKIYAQTLHEKEIMRELLHKALKIN
jgi:hypothetical protein